jgi:hypothetical protein
MAVPFVPTIPIMEVDDLRPGMKGYGLSVFEGTEPRRFDITIKGVLRGRFAGGEMIIIEATDPILEDIGGVAGMSGSPIFVDDKLVGAFAYGWGFSVRAINGVTPIRAMLKVMEEVTVESRVAPEDRVSLAAWPEARAALAAAHPRLPDITVPSSEISAFGLQSEGDTVTLRPLGTPLMVGTTSPVVFQKVQELFAGTAFQPVMAGLQGGAVGSNPTTRTDLRHVNGGALGVVLCEGDLNLAGLGTTTYVQGDRLIGFGHPMSGTGAVDVPIAISEVVAIVPSVMRPFKLGNALKKEGALRQDRLPAVGASLSAPTPAMVPLTVRINAPEMNLHRDFQFNLWNERRTMPVLALICFMETMEAARMGGPTGLDFRYTLHLKDGRKLSQRQFVSGEGSVGLMSAFEAMLLMDVLLNNRFEELAVSSIEATMDLTDRTRMMVFDRLTNKLPPEIHPGDTLRLEAEYLQWRRPDAVLPIEVTVPADLPPGDYQLHVTDGSSRAMLEFEFQPHLRRIESVDDLLRAAQPHFPNDAVYVLLVDPRAEATINDQPVGTMPRTIAQLTQETTRTANVVGQRRIRLVSETRLPHRSMVLGSSIIPFTVVERPQ